MLMSVISTYPFVVIGGIVVAFGALIEVASRMIRARQPVAGSPQQRQRGLTLARLSFVIGLTLIVLGLAVGPS